MRPATSHCTQRCSLPRIMLRPSISTVRRGEELIFWSLPCNETHDCWRIGDCIDQVFAPQQVSPSAQTRFSPLTRAFCRFIRLQTSSTNRAAGVPSMGERTASASLSGSTQRNLWSKLFWLRGPRLQTEGRYLVNGMVLSQKKNTISIRRLLGLAWAAPRIANGAVVMESIPRESKTPARLDVLVWASTICRRGRSVFLGFALEFANLPNSPTIESQFPKC